MRQTLAPNVCFLQGSHSKLSYRFSGPHCRAEMCSRSFTLCSPAGRKWWGHAHCIAQVSPEIFLTNLLHFRKLDHFIMVVPGTAHFGASIFHIFVLFYAKNYFPWPYHPVQWEKKDVTHFWGLNSLSIVFLPGLCLGHHLRISKESSAAE